MAVVVVLSTVAQVEHHDLFFWMERVLNELESVRSSLDQEAVDDLRADTAVAVSFVSCS